MKEREIIKDEAKFRELDQQFRPSGFKAMMGAEAIKELLKRVQIDELGIELRERMKTETSAQKNRLGTAGACPAWSGRGLAGIRWGRLGRIIDSARQQAIADGVGQSADLCIPRPAGLFSRRLAAAVPLRRSAQPRPDDARVGVFLRRCDRHHLR